ncbi:MAG: AMP-binding protein, partial [Bacteroidota bacterium]
MESAGFLSQIRQNFSSQPDRRAFYIAGTSYSYGELSALVAEIQQKIRQAPGTNDHVGVWLGDDIQTYASILALWMSGMAFVPVNPLFPEARNRKIIEQTALKLLLHSHDFDENLLIPGCTSISTGNLQPLPGRIPE